MTDRICIIGASGFGREVMDVATAAGYVDFVFLEASDGHEPIDGFPVQIETPERIADLSAAGWHFAIGIGTPGPRRKIAARLRDCHCPALIHPDASFGRNQLAVARQAVGLVVAAGARLMNRIQIGQHCVFSLNATIGHDTIADDFATVMPGVNISGNVHLGEGCYIGTGAAVIHGDNARKLSIGANATVGAGAVVIRDIPAGTTAVGVPARVLPAR